MTHSERLNVGELAHTGVVLYTREVVAIVHEACDGIRNAGQPLRFPQSADDLWITSTGELQIELSDNENATTDPRIASAALLDALLPLASKQPEYAVPPSLRTLPARLRESAALLGSASPHDLRTILKWQTSGDPAVILQQLVIRTNHSPVSDIPPLLVPRSSEAVRRVDTAAAQPAAPAVRPPIVSPEITPSVERDVGIGAADDDSPHRAWPQQSGTIHRFVGGAGADEEPGDGARASLPGVTIGSRAAALHLPSVALGVGAAALLAVLSAFAGYAYTREWPSARLDDESNSTASSNAAGAGRERTKPVDKTELRDEHPLILPSSDGAFSPSFTANGKGLYFHAGRMTGRLLHAELDDRGIASNITPVLAPVKRGDISSDSHVRLSPDGRRVAFDSDRDGERGVYVARPGGADASRISDSGFAMAPSWSPDMRWLAFVRGEPKQRQVRNLWLRDLASETLTRLTAFGDGQEGAASWFPDGGRLCYGHETELIIHDLSTRKTEIFRTPVAGRLVRSPAVSPDGGRIVFQVQGEGVWMLALQAGKMTPILDDATAEEFAWHPDGKRIAYQSGREGQWRIWMMTAPRL